MAAEETGTPTKTLNTEECACWELTSVQNVMASFVKADRYYTDR